MSVRPKPPLRHPSLPTVLLPWLDARLVTISTVCEYLDTDYQGVYRLAREGCFAGPGCTYPLPVDGRRPPGAVTRYCPAAIWGFNKWVPAPQVVALLVTADAAWAGYAQQLAALSARAQGDRPEPTTGRAQLRVVTA